MNYKAEALRLFNEFYLILFDSESDKSEEILISVLAKKCAIKHLELKNENPEFCECLENEKIIKELEKL